MSEWRLIKGICVADDSEKTYVEKPTLTLLVRFFKKVGCVVLVTGVLV